MSYIYYIYLNLKNYNEYFPFLNLKKMSHIFEIKKYINIHIMNTKKRTEFVFREKIKRNIFNPTSNIKDVIPNLFKEYDKIYKDDPIDQNMDDQKYEMRLRILIYLLYIFYDNNTKDNANEDFYNKNKEFLMIKQIPDERFDKIKINIISSINNQYHLKKMKKTHLKPLLKVFLQKI